MQEIPIHLMRLAIAVLVFFLLFVGSSQANVLTCNGTWKSGKSFTMQFRKDNKVRYCISGSCRVIDTARNTITKALFFWDDEPKTSIVVLKKRGRYSASIKTRPFPAKVVWADCK